MAGDRGLVVTSQHQGDAFTITTFIPPRRNGGPNCGAYGAVMVALAKIVPDAFDPEPAPGIVTAAQYRADALGEPMPHDVAAALERDLQAGRVQLDDAEPYPIPGCTSGACQGD